MHIVWVIRRFYPLLLGGTEIRMKQIGEALLARGYKITVLTRRLEPNLTTHDEISGMEINRFPPSSMLFQLRVKRWIKENHRSIEAIHTFRFDKLGMLGAWSQKKYGIPQVADIITNELTIMIESKKKVKIDRIVKGTQLVHCLNRHTAALLGQLGVPAKKIWYRPNAVNTELFSPVDTEGEQKSPVTFLCCGRFDNQKGHEFLIAAWKMLSKELRSKARLILAGSGKREADFRKQAEGAPEIIFVGEVKREAIPGYYRQAQVYIHPSKFEGMSNSILEALASGLPVITTDVEGNADLVTPGLNGLLVPYGEIDELANAITILLENPELRRKMGTNSRKLAVAKYSMAILYDEYDQTYKNLQKPRVG